jgi:hypothetical protein
MSVYIKDARTQALPLVGGGEHDWALLLDQWGRLEQDQQLGGAMYLVGVLLYLIAVVAGWLLLRPPSDKPDDLLPKFPASHPK